MVLLILDEPVLVVIAYASLGTLFMPFLAGTLLWLLNRRVTREYRNGLLADLKLGASVLLFIYVGIQEVSASCEAEPAPRGISVLNKT